MSKLKNLVIVSIIAGICISMTACGSSSNSSGSSSTSSPTQTSSATQNSGNSEGGTIIAGDNVKWPSNLMANLPEPKCKLSGLLQDNGTGVTTVAFAEMTKEDAAAYVVKLKGLGYTGGMEISDKDSIMYSGTLKSSGGEASFIYNVEAKEGIITYNPNKPVSTTADMTDAAEWPSNFIKNVPELTGKIVNVVNNNDKDVTVSLEYVQKADFEAYIAQLKKNGYTVEADQTSSVTSIDFRAYNSDREWVRAYFNVKDADATVEMEKASDND